jgi:hypothetical protein
MVRDPYLVKKLWERVPTYVVALDGIVSTIPDACSGANIFFGKCHQSSAAD